MLKNPKKILQGFAAIIVALIIIPQVVYAKAPTIKKINNLSVTVQMGTKYTLPSKIKATMANNKSQNVVVKWNVKSVNTANVGSFKYTGSVISYSKKVILSLKVVAPTKTVVVTPNKPVTPSKPVTPVVTGTTPPVDAGTSATPPETPAP